MRIDVNFAMEAEAENADLLVMGAYTRDRVSCLIFGGVTREILTHVTIPVLMLDCPIFACRNGLQMRRLL